MKGLGKTNDVAGDGTTTATVWPSAVREGLRNVAAGANPMVMRLGMEKAVEIVLAALENGEANYNA